MSIHYLCDWNCGGTDCSAPTRPKPENLEWVWTASDGTEHKTKLKAVSHDIKQQPFY